MDKIDITEEWKPPSSPLTPSQLQRGETHIYQVKNERAERPFSVTLKHWSTLPALSHFILSSMSVRAKKNGIKAPHRVKHPKMAPLEPGEVEIWFTQLRNNSVKLESLIDTVPSTILDCVLLFLLNYKVPISRAVWCIKCVSASARSLKTLPPSELRQFWFNEFSVFLDNRISEYDNSPVWQQDIQYSAELCVDLFSNRMIDNHSFLLWCVNKLTVYESFKIPCMIHFIYLFWPAFEDDFYANQLLNSLVSWFDRLDFNKLSELLGPILWKLMSTNKDTLVAPHAWNKVSQFLSEHPYFKEINSRNMIFLKPSLCNLEDTYYNKDVDILLQNFALPYNVDELISNMESLGLSITNLGYNLVLYTIRLHSYDVIQLCKTILKHFERKYGIFIGHLVVPYMLKSTFTNFDRKFISCLVSELYKEGLLDLDFYLTRIITSGITSEQADTPQKSFHISILQNLPFEVIPEKQKRFIDALLNKVGAPVPEQDLTPSLDIVRAILKDKIPHVYGLQCGDDLRSIYKKQLTDAMVDMVKKGAVYFERPQTLANFCRMIMKNSEGSFEPLMSVLCLAVNLKMSSVRAVCAGLRLFRIHIMAFTCLGQVEHFIESLNVGIQSHGDDILNVCRDDIDAIKACIKNPHVLFEFEKVIPHRSDLEFSQSFTPSELIPVRDLIKSDGPLDINELLSISHEDDFVEVMKEYVQRPLCDRLSILKLICYQAVNIDDLWDPETSSIELLKLFVLFPASVVGFRYDELASLREARVKFIEKLPFEMMIKFLAHLEDTNTHHILIHYYVETSLNHIIRPALQDPQRKELVLETIPDKKIDFDYVFTQCTPFSLRYFQGIVLLIISEHDMDTNVNLILDAAYRHPHAMTILYEIFTTIPPALKEKLLIKSVSNFLEAQLPIKNRDFLDVSSILFEVTKDAVTPNTVWPVEAFERYLEQIISIGERLYKSVEVPVRALTLIVQIIIMGSMQSFNISDKMISHLKTIIELETFPFTVGMRTLLTDSYRLLALKPRDNHQPDIKSITDGLRLYSRCTNTFSDLPLSYFDLIEEIRQVQERNSYPIDLNLFETYHADT